MSSNRGDIQATIGQGFLKGDPGDSAYELDVENGYTGTLEQWLAELHNKGRVTTLDGTSLASAEIIEAAGIPVYVDDVTQYAAYGITDTGWYVFARITSKDGTRVTAETTVEGAAGCVKTIGDDHIDVAVRFEVASVSQMVVIDWGGYAETFVFKATDLAIRNLDYRVTFYVYDIDDFATWEYARSTDETFVGTKYYTEENGVYTQAAVKAYEHVPADTYYTHAYIKSEDEVFQDGTTYYTLSGGVYSPMEVTPGEKLTPDGVDPAPVYYVDQWTLTTDTSFVGDRYFGETEGNYEQIAVKAGDPCSYYTKVVEYPLTEDMTFVGTAYWTPDDSDLGYTRVAVVAGEQIPEDEFYTHTYTKLTAAGKFAEGVRYYKLVDGEYELQEVTVGASYTKNVYYIDTWTEATGSFVGTAYWIETDGVWSQAAVIAGESVPEGMYHLRVVSWPQATEDTFADGTTYYTKSGEEYTAADVTAGEAIPAYYKHSKVTFEGMTRNITYRCNTPIDCPMVFNLPEIEDETHGCWYEIRFQHTGSFSSTLNVPEGVKVATEHTQAETKGMNMVDLHYTSIGGLKLWRFMNTHSSIPA